MHAAEPLLALAPGPVFARHESFHPRYGWLKKGFDLFADLAEPDAPVRLGVGKNMVNAIRYWSLAFKILEEVPTARGESPRLVRSALGNQIFGSSGLDPYMESPATLWLLHWHLLRAPCTATAWHFAFFTFNRSEFTSEELAEALWRHKQARFPQARATEGSIKKDAGCLLRMYGRTSAVGRATAEDTLDSPFVELGLIAHGAGAHHFGFRIGPKPSLPPELIVAACLDFMATDPSVGAARTIGVGRLLDEPGAPGRAFKLSELALCEAFEQVAKGCPDIRLAETAGVLQVTLNVAPAPLAADLLDGYYKQGAAT